jgi:glycerol-3-phosphate cytidylyltransferase
LFLSCGYGDLAMTSLTNLSRNRTLGLFIGKGFYNHEDKSRLVLEGMSTLKIINSSLDDSIKQRLPLFSKLEKYFSNKNENFEIYFDDLINKKMKTVLTYGTFDMLHYGHLEILRRAKEHGDRLIVGLSTDEFNNEKEKQSHLSYDKRKELLEALEYVDLVIPENTWEQKTQDVLKNQVDIFIMGDDWKGKFDFLKDYCEVLYLPRTDGISSTKLKSILQK